MSDKAKPGDTVELKTKDGGFYDFETGFQIRNSEKVALGDRIGTRTNEALISGGLLVVSGKKKSAAKADDGKVEKTAATKTSDFPEDFPGREVLNGLGVSLAQVKAMSAEQRIALNGIGPKTAEAIDEYLK